MNRLGRDDPLEHEIFGLLLAIADTHEPIEKDKLVRRLAKLQAAKQRALADLAAESITESQLADDSLMDGGRYARSEYDMAQLLSKKRLSSNDIRPDNA